MPDYKQFRRKDYPYPATLEAKYWDKKKSLRAKIAGETGVGDALKGAENAYNKIDWDTLEFGTRFSGNKFNVQEWKSLMEMAVAEARHGLLAFVRTLENVNKVALAASKKFKENKLADDLKLADSIAGEADLLASKLHWNVVVPVLVAEHNDNLKTFQKIVDDLKVQLKKALGESVVAVQEMRKDSTPVVFEKKQIVTRKITQVIGNVERYQKMGFEVALDANEAKKLFNQLGPYANGEVTLPKEASAAQVNKAIDALWDILRKVEPLTH